VAGRVWCGFACPQTVYTEIFLWIERRFEGARSARIRLDRQPWTLEKLARKGGKHAAWLAVALWTGFTFVGYFAPIRSLMGETLAFALGPWQTFWVLFYSFATYGNAGWMREQVCKYMCPYARFQSSMFDKDTLIVTYDTRRGEPRGPKSGGDCIDCSMCVQVCPTGIDIRKGLQYECIGCAACIDACNIVMTKVDKPLGLIRYATENALDKGWTPAQVKQRLLRPRVLVYTAVLGMLVAAMVASLALRNPIKLDVIRDRGSMGREVEDGRIENVYRLQLMNTTESPLRLQVGVSGIESVFVADAEPIEIDAATTRAVPVRVRIEAGMARPGSHKIEFVVSAVSGASLDVTEEAAFIVPR